MFKKLSIILLILLLGTAANAQIKTYGVAQVGSFAEKGQAPAWAMCTGANTIINQDTAKHFTIYNRTGFFHVNRIDPEINGAQTFLAVQKTIPMAGVDWNISIGAGLLYEIEEGSDNKSGTALLEFSATLYKSLSIGVGINYVPIKEQYDQQFLYAMIDLFP